ncbi:MAG TPA: DUF5919 domain-containing protein [Pyrinomonadaceae bacterium]|nr:DUF5919 domain-containing protein [Pyrinomonadaceae bacterium]
MTTKARLASLSQFLRQHGEVTLVLSVGAVLVLIGMLLWERYQRVAPTLISIGTSLIAAGLVTLLNPTNRELFQKFLSLGVRDVYLSRSDVPFRRWIQWIKAARADCTIMGISNSNWCKDPGFKPALMELVSRDVTVKMFFLNPNSPVAERRTKEEESEVGRDTIGTIRNSIKHMWNLRGEVEEQRRDNFTLYVYDATPSFGVTWVDTLMIATHYLAGVPNVTSPCVVIRPMQSATSEGDLYGVYDQNLRNIEKHHATKITEDNIVSFVPVELPTASV